MEIDEKTNFKIGWKRGSKLFCYLRVISLDLKNEVKFDRFFYENARKELYV